MNRFRILILGFEPTNHFRDGRLADLQPVDDARLDDIDGVLVQFEDALAVFLESRVMLAWSGHGATLPLADGVRSRSHWRTVGRARLGSLGSYLAGAALLQ